MKTEQAIQEGQYAFPYHYIPQASDNGFSQNAYWSWGFRYLGGLTVARQLCDERPYGSLIDLGCGDGRFISELSRHGGARRLLGVDYSERAIALARGLNPGLDYVAANILEDDLGGERFDVVTAIEVIEHIPPADLPDFIDRAVSLIRPGGRLILTVPHKNKRVNEKHFQHFDSDGLKELLQPHVEDMRFVPFDFPSRMLSLWFRVLGWTGNCYVITWKPMLHAFYRYYLTRCLLGGDESSCLRIACVANVRARGGAA